MFDKFALLNANIGDVLYVRNDDKVTAVKLVKILCGEPNVSCGRGVFGWLLIAGEGGEPKRVYLGNKTTKFYPTIEDCINDTNPIERCLVTEEDLTKRCGLQFEGIRTSVGIGYWGCWKFIWDGFRPKRISLAAFEFNFICDENGWHCDYKDSVKKQNLKYYDTYEDCIADNQVKVVVF